MAFYRSLPFSLLALASTTFAAQPASTKSDDPVQLDAFDVTADKERNFSLPLDAIALAHHPFDDRALGHAHGELGQDHFMNHGQPRPQTSRIASSMRSTVGIVYVSMYPPGIGTLG